MPRRLAGMDDTGKEVIPVVKISVIMGIYQEKEEYLRQAVASVLGQTEQDLELIACLDGNQPHLREVLEALAASDGRIHILEEQENHGLGYVLNRCIEAAGGEYLARMDSDDLCVPERLEKQAAFLEDHPEYDFVGCNARLFDDHGVYGGREMKEAPGREDFYEYLPFIHPSVMFRREVFTGGVRYPETEETLRCEDLALFMDLYARDMRGYNLQEYLYLYREDKGAFAKKKYRYRLIESRVRAEGYEKLRLQGPKPFVYTVKPLAVGLIPAPLMLVIKRQRDAKDIGYETEYSNV